jgi:transposase
LPIEGSASALPACGASSNADGSRSKKDRHAAEQDRPDGLSRREEWFEGQFDLDPHTLVFIDETGASTKMARLHRRAPRGERLRAAIPHGHWKTTTFVGALRLTGMTVPPYSPDFNPIENASAKLKTLLRKAAAGTVDHLWRVIGDCLDAFTPAECA